MTFRRFLVALAGGILIAAGFLLYVATLVWAYGRVSAGELELEMFFALLILGALALGGCAELLLSTSAPSREVPQR